MSLFSLYLRLHNCPRKNTTYIYKYIYTSYSNIYNNTHGRKRWFTLLLFIYPFNQTFFSFFFSTNCLINEKIYTSVRVPDNLFLSLPTTTTTTTCFNPSSIPIPCLLCVYMPVIIFPVWPYSF